MNELIAQMSQQLQTSSKTLESYEKALLSPKEGADLEFIKKSIEHYRGDVGQIRSQLVTLAQTPVITQSPS